MIIIGDVHTKINNYWKILGKHKTDSIQIGDFGFHKSHKWHMDNIDSSKHKVLFGNHDDYTKLYEEHSLGDFGMFNDEIFFTRGAKSIDKHDRILGLDYFSNEELSYFEMCDAVDLYEVRKPKIMLSHDCPFEVRRDVFNITDKCNTVNGLQMMFELHQPDIWIFGHHHKSKDIMINGTRFICLAELETFNL